MYLFIFTFTLQRLKNWTKFDWALVHRSSQSTTAMRALGGQRVNSAKGAALDFCRVPHHKFYAWYRLVLAIVGTQVPRVLLSTYLSTFVRVHGRTW
jgi:hypothetical protein